MKLFYTARPVQSRAFLETVLSQYCGIISPRIAQTQNGKPYLLDAPLCFNLSHSGEITAVAVSEFEVGLDIQKREERNASAIQKRLTPAEQEEDFFAVWTAKEAYVKLRGGTLAGMLSPLEFRGGTLYENGTPVNAHLLQFELEGCAASVFSQNDTVLEPPIRL